MIPIIILNWNGSDDTLECLEALSRQTFRDFTIFLVDNGSEMEDRKKLIAGIDSRADIKYIQNDENLGFTEANNRVLEELLALEPLPSYVALLNNDTAPLPEWLEFLITTAEKSGAGMVSSKLVNYQNTKRMDNAGHILLNSLEVLPLGHDEPTDHYTTQMENSGACAGAALYSLPMLREIGIFDQRFSNGYEDVELGLRAILCGYKAVYAPDAIVLHKISRSVNKVRDFNYTENIQRHIYYFQGKLFPWPVLLVCLPTILFRVVGAFLINILSLRWRYLNVQLVAFGRFIQHDWKATLRARRAFHRDHKLISNREIFSKMHFFWKYDWRRFRKYILRGEKMVFERY